MNDAVHSISVGTILFIAVCAASDTLELVQDLFSKSLTHISGLQPMLNQRVMLLMPRLIIRDVTEFKL